MYFLSDWRIQNSFNYVVCRPKRSSRFSKFSGKVTLFVCRVVQLTGPTPPCWKDVLSLKLECNLGQSRRPDTLTYKVQLRVHPPAF